MFAATILNLAQNISVFIRIQEYYSIYKLHNLVPPVGIEPTSSGLQPVAMTTSAKAAKLVSMVGFEPTAS